MITETTHVYYTYTSLRSGAVVVKGILLSFTHGNFLILEAYKRRDIVARKTHLRFCYAKSIEYVILFKQCDLVTI